MLILVIRYKYDGGTNVKKLLVIPKKMGGPP